MNRRLFFLLPDNKQAGKLAVELEHDIAIKQQNIHAVARDEMQINGVDDVHRMNERDKDAVIEWWAWRINLAVFFISLLAFAVMLLWSPSFWLIIPAVMVVGTFVVGLAFVLRLPSVHVDEFFSALRHGEILMMVDVTTSQLSDVSRYIRRRHPEAITGGVSWHM